MAPWCDGGGKTVQEEAQKGGIKVKRRKLKHCVTTEGPWTVLICLTKRKGKARKNKRGFRQRLFRKRPGQLLQRGALWVGCHIHGGCRNVISHSLSSFPSTFSVQFSGVCFSCYLSLRTFSVEFKEWVCSMFKITLVGLIFLVTWNMYDIFKETFTLFIHKKYENFSISIGKEVGKSDDSVIWHFWHISFILLTTTWHFKNELTSLRCDLPRWITKPHKHPNFRENAQRLGWIKKTFLPFV